MDNNKIILSGIVFVVSALALVLCWQDDDGFQGGFGRRSLIFAALFRAFGEPFWIILTLFSGGSFLYFILKHFHLV